MTWWQRGAIYQIYPRSFADANGDGVGDLKGIQQHLDYLEELKVAAIWLSPIFTSPMADFGYDVSDYRDVDPTFGTLADLDDLLADCHARGIRLVLDWIPSHTSNRHPWFAERPDFYVWRDEPNGWRSEFEAVGSAWTFDEARGQYYLHSFMAEQPDLNWDNPEVEAAMHDTLRFWLDRGVDGFRIDALQRIAKDPLLRDNVPGERRRDQDWETINARIAGIRRVVDEYEDRMIVGETAIQDLERLASFINSGEELHLAHNFVFAELPWDAAAFRASIDEFEALTTEHAWPAWFLGNHDLPRLRTRFDDGGQGAARARACALMLYALRGTPFIYQGDELGLPDAVVPADRVVDVDGRDPERAPIPWEPGERHGFTTGAPWLPFVAEADELCVAAQDGDDTSILALCRRLAALRADTPALQTGGQEPVDAGADILAWRRDGWLVAINFAAAPRPLGVDVGATGRWLSTDPRRTDVADLTLAAGEGLLLQAAGG